jgi:hypothetical protein
MNFSWRDACFACAKPRPEGVGGPVRKAYTGAAVTGAPYGGAAPVGAFRPRERRPGDWVRAAALRLGVAAA